MGEKVLKINDLDKKSYFLLINFGDSLLNVTLLEQNKDSLSTSILGTEERHTRELRDGLIKNIEDVYVKLNDSIKSIEGDTKLVVSELKHLSVIATISSKLGQRVSSQGILNFINNEISEENIEKLVQLALYNGDISKDTMAINYRATTFKVDGVSITNPINMSGKRLEVELDIQTLEKNHFNNFKKVVNECGLDINYMHFDANNVMEAVLSEEDMEYGSIIIEYGLNSSKLIFVKDNKVVNIRTTTNAAKQVVAKMAHYYGLKYPEASKIYDNLDYIFDYAKHDGYFEIEKTTKEVQAIELSPLKEIIMTESTKVLENIHTQLSKDDISKYKNGVVFVNETNIDGLDFVVMETFPNINISFKSNQNVLNMHKSIMGVEKLKNRFDILGDVKFVTKFVDYKYDHKNNRYPSQVKETPLSNSTDLTDIELSKFVDLESNVRKMSLLKSIKKTIIELW